MRRNYYIVFVLLIFVYGCGHGSLALSKTNQTAATNLSESYSIGTPSAEQIAKAWPFVSGQIKGLYSKDYDDALPNSIKFIVTKLDEICAKPVLTDLDKGLISGYTVRLDALFAEMAYQDGVKIFRMVSQYAAGL